MSFDANNLYYRDNLNNNLLTNQTVKNLQDQIKSTSLMYKLISLIKTYWYVIILIVIIIVLYKRYKSVHESFAVPTFNPYHPVNVNQNYTHYLGNDPVPNGVYNNSVQPVNYKNVEFLGIFDKVAYDFPNTRPVINTTPIYYTPKVVSDNNNKYKKINEENINDIVKITYKKSKLDNV